MNEFDLGPNGALVYCMEYLLINSEWLEKKLDCLDDDVHYVLFDCPGQVLFSLFLLLRLFYILFIISINLYIRLNSLRIIIVLRS